METTKIQGKLGVNKDQLISLLGSTMYRGDVQNVAVKELIQNSFDAVKIAKSLDSSHQSCIKVDISNYERTIVVSDNGTGMTPEIVQKAFFTIGGSYKGNVDNRLKSGGLGLAKMAFLFSSESVEVSTVKDGTKTHVYATPEQIKTDSFELEVSKTLEPNGTTVKVVIPKSYLDNNGEERLIFFRPTPDFLSKPMLGDVKLTVNGEESDKSQLPKGYLYIGRATAAFGDMDIYITHSADSTMEIHTLISGLYQFTKREWGDDRQSLKVIVNILPTVSVNDPLYPINNQREGFRGTVDAEVKDLIKLLNKIKAAYLRGQYAAAFSNCLSMEVGKISEPKRAAYTGDILKQAVAEVLCKDSSEFEPFTFTNSAELHEAAQPVKEDDRKSTFDASGILIPQASMVDVSKMSLDKPVFHNNTNMVIEEDAMEFLKKFGALLLELKRLHLLAYTGKSRVDKARWYTVPLTERESHQFWGISFDKGYQGVNVSPKVFDFLAVNPFGFALPEWEGIDQALYISECITHVIIHEFNHNFESSEGSAFTGSLVKTEAEFTAIGTSYEAWKTRLYNLVKKNLALINLYHKKYREASNIGTSLDM